MCIAHIFARAVAGRICEAIAVLTKSLLYFRGWSIV